MSGGAFKVGEVLVGQNFVFSPDRNGDECTVVRELMVYSATHRVTRVPETGAYYVVEWADGDITSVKPINLRRKQPPTGLAAILRMFDVAAPVPRETESA